MGTDKSSKKRKRVQDENELLQEDDLPSHEKSTKKKRKIKHEDDLLTEEHESAENKHPKKKRKIHDENDLSIEEHSQSSKSKQKKKSKNENSDVVNSGKTSKKTKGDQFKDKPSQEEKSSLKKSKKKINSVTQKDVSSPEQEDAHERINSSSEAEEELEMVSTKERLKPKKKGKKNLKVSPSSPKEEEDETDSEIEESLPKKKGKKTKKESSSSSNEEEGSDSDTEEQSKLTNSKNKGEQSSSFGVVDTKLLRDHGGQEVKNKKKMKPKPPNQLNRALNYLRMWKNNFKSWKFSKLYQARLMKNLYNPVVTERDFEACLEYFEKCQGKAREKLKSDAMAFINEDEGESVDVEKEGRARQVLQMLG